MADGTKEEDKALREALRLLIEDGAGRPETEIRAILKRTEVREEARTIMMNAAVKFVRDCYSVAETIANREDSAVPLVTSSHARTAVREIWLRSHRIDYADGAVALGGLLCGLGLDKAYDAATFGAVVLAVIGAALVAGGLVFKWR